MASTIVRRSLLAVSVFDAEHVADCWRYGADAVILDITAGDPETARCEVRASVNTARRGGAEVFVKVNPQLAYADIEAAAWPGLTGIVISSPEREQDVSTIAEILEDTERRHGIVSGSLQIIALLGTAAGVWNMREIVAGSPRVTAVALDESELCRTLGIVPREDFDPFEYAKGRLVIEATAADVQPVGISHPLGVLPRLVGGEEEVFRLAQRGRNLGFKGTICPHPSWVAPCNRAFTPTSEPIEYYREVRRVFADGIAKGTAAVPLGGQMVDVPVDERAKVMIALWERCQRREAEKASALAAARA